MANPILNSLVDGFNAQISVMNKNNLKIYDADNPEYYITGVEYRVDDDCIIFKTDEDPDAYLK